MDLCTPEGEKVIFLGTGGYPGDLKATMEVLTVGEEYTVQGASIGRSSSTVYLEGFNRPFNTVMFENVEGYNFENDDREYIFDSRNEYGYI